MEDMSKEREENEKFSLSRIKLRKDRICWYNEFSVAFFISTITKTNIHESNVTLLRNGYIRLNSEKNNSWRTNSRTANSGKTKTKTIEFQEGPTRKRGLRRSKKRKKRPTKVKNEPELRKKGANTKRV